MKIVVGLGNPGKQYEDTRHNVGWMVLDRIADRAGWSGRGKSRDSASVARGRVGDLDLVLVKPLTYMNLSGEAVRKVLQREHAPLADLLIVFDDFDLPLGRLRLRAEGSAGSHNGMRSIVGELGTQKIARLRVGIGEPSRTAIDHVLSRFDGAERRTVELVVDAAADAVEDWARDGVARAANQWNSWTGAVPLLLPAAATPDAGNEGPPAVDPSAPDKDGIVRSKTGWRKLLARGDEDARR
ncbi:MAG: aminoacyl-tRNA hydrolase [Candidatus Limnocylindrales bacterium]